MILEEIVAAKRQELVRSQAELPLPELEKRILQQAPALDFGKALRGEGVSVIAEVKKASPSKGLLCPNFDPVALAQTYAASGASAVSVLTEADYFQGSLKDLASIKQKVQIPLLRKDFLFDVYQIYESRAFGADAVLLITAILTDKELQKFLSLSHGLGMQCLVEVHDHTELERVTQSSAKIIGINNRNLHTFAVDITTTERLISLVPRDRIVVSESGIRGREDVQRLREWGVDAILVGEALVTAEDVAAKLRELI